jgi:hypothetical protein
MLIFEVVDSGPGSDPGAQKLTALVTLLTGRSHDQNGPQEISKTAFISMANSLGVAVTPDSLPQLLAQPPLSNVLEQDEPNSPVLRFRGNVQNSTDMSVNQAQDIVAKNAQSALNRAK